MTTAPTTTVRATAVRGGGSVLLTGRHRDQVRTLEHALAWVVLAVLVLATTTTLLAPPPVAAALAGPTLFLGVFAGLAKVMV